jgi:hypothetical protein
MGSSEPGRKLEMKKLLPVRKFFVSALAIAITLSPIAARASIVETYECGATKSNPPDNDRDPIVKIKVQIVIAAGSNEFRSFDVDHYAASGKIYSRQEQYRDRRYRSNDKADSWSGISVKTRSLTMVGSLKADGQVEQQFRAGRLQATTISACRAVEEESH